MIFWPTTQFVEPEWILFWNHLIIDISYFLFFESFSLSVFSFFYSSSLSNRLKTTVVVYNKFRLLSYQAFQIVIGLTQK